MLRALKRLLGGGAGRGRDEAQLSLALEPSRAALRDAEELLDRLRGLGLRKIERCRLTNNRNVMVSYRGADVRVHRGYLAAPDDVLRAIVVFVEGRTRVHRRAARQRIMSFKVGTGPGVTRRERTHPDDEALAERLVAWHARFNAQHFGGALRTVPVRVSRRMKSRLGHYTAATGDAPGEIAISRRHWRRHGWDEALHTLLHEMVHQWQDEQGQPIDHGRRFRAKAREVGIEASARRKAG